MAYDLFRSKKEAFAVIKKVTDDAIKKGYKVIGLSASNENEIDPLTREYGLNFDFYFTDQTTLKTIIRSNPGLVELNKGTVMQKLHYNDAEDLKLETLPNANLNMDLDMKRQLDSVLELDQKYRALLSTAQTKAELDSLWGLQHAVDKSNTEFIEKIIEKHGYPGKSLVGEPTNKAAWYVIQHSEKIPDYLDLMKEAGKNGELPFRNVAMMEDRYLMGENKEQIYGTQGMTYFIDGEEVGFMWPIKDAENVNQRRKEAGFTQDIEEYSLELGITYKPVTLEEAEKLRQRMINSNKN